MKICATVVCTNVALAEVFWPGREPLAMCEACAARAVATGAVLGCHVPVRPLKAEPEEASS